MKFLKEYNTEYDDHRVNQNVVINKMKSTIELPIDYFVTPDDDDDDDDDYYTTSADKDGLYHGTEPGYNKGVNARNTAVYKMSAESKILTYKQFETNSSLDFSDITLLSKNEIIKYINMGIDINIRCYQDETFLFFAVQKNEYDLVKYLLELGANPNLTNIYNFTSMYYAAIHSYLNIIDILIQYGSTCFIDSTFAILNDLMLYLTSDELKTFKRNYPDSYKKYLKEKKMKKYNI